MEDTNPVDDPAAQSYNHGRAAMEAGDYSSAVQHFTLAARSAPHFKTFELLGECFIAVQQPNDAILYLSAAAGLGNRQFRSRYLLARALVMIGKPRLAIDKLTEAVELQPTYRAAKTLLDELRRAHPSRDEV